MSLPRYPGPLGQWGNELALDDGTLCRGTSPRPGSLGLGWELGAPSPRETAYTQIKSFSRRTAKGAFALNRQQVADGLLERIQRPSSIYQGKSSLCGPAALFRSLATDSPLTYARFVMDVYENGRARLGMLDIEPGEGTRRWLPSAIDPEVPPVDWIPLASLRDSENALFAYDSPDDEFAGITMPNELEEWFRKVGYTTVIEKARVFGRGTYRSDDVAEINAYMQRRYHVCLLIHDCMLDRATQDNFYSWPTHWVILTTELKLSGAPGQEEVSFEVFTWGRGDYKVPDVLGGPPKPMKLTSFLNNYYGYIACSA